MRIGEPTPRSSTPTLVIASGKGGTGKTTVAVNLAVAAARAGARVTLVDADVEEPNDHLFLAVPRSRTREVLIPVAHVDDERCTVCGACRDACRFGAVRILGGKVVVFPEMCHGCGACSVACLADAMGESTRRVGEVSWGEIDPLVCCAESTGAVHLVTGRLDVGDVHAPDVIRAARRAGADTGDPNVIIVDAAPGVSCSAVAASSDADALLLVTEPSVFGLHDLALAIELGELMDLPMGVVVNRARPDARDVHTMCEAASVPLLGEIPFDRRAAEIHARGSLLVNEHLDGPAWFSTLWDSIATALLAPKEGVAA